MKSRAFMIFFIAAIFIFVALPATSRAVSFPITYEGTVHVEAYIPYLSGGCEGDQKMKITLNKNGTLTGTEEFIVSTPGPNKTACQIISDKSMGIQGTYNEAEGKFDAKISSIVEVSGTFDDEKITGQGSGSEVGLDLTLSFTLPKVQAISQYPKITLEPATYPEFQMNILEGKGFTIKIRKEDGVKDDQGNWKLNFSTLLLETNGVDNTKHFLKTLAPMVISENASEVLIKIIPDPKVFMLEQNMFNILWNGEHKIGLQICDTNGRCGKSEYTIYFGPFVLFKSVTDQRCTEGKEEIFNIEKLILANVGYDCPMAGIYMALSNADPLSDFWCLYFDNFAFWWMYNMVTPFFEIPVSGATLVMIENFQLDLKLVDPINKPISAGNYRFLAIVIDNLSGAWNGTIKDAEICSLY